MAGADPGVRNPVEKTRRGVEAMEVAEEEATEKASMGRIRERITSAAREGWGKLVGRLRGKEIKREGSVLVVEKTSQETGVESRISEEMKGEWLDENEIGRVEVEVVEGNNGRETDSVKSNESRQTRVGFDFLDAMTDEGKDEELERVRQERRKRKRGEDEVKCKEGMMGIPGWEWREKEEREEKRWKREVMGWTVREGDERIRVKRWEKVPLPENFRLGLEERGVKLNHSGRPKNNFGTNKAPLFPGGKDGKQESRNWFASFTKSGCLSCRDKDGKVTHKSRTGDPVILVIGDETAPTVVGYTEKDSGEDTCAWVFKK
jgi:hypothetical protein